MYRGPGLQRNGPTWTKLWGLFPKIFCLCFSRNQALRKESECSKTSRHTALSLLSHVLSLSNVLCFAGYIGLFLAPKDKDTLMESRDYEGTSEPMDDGDVSGLGNLQQVRALTPEGGARTWTEGRNSSPMVSEWFNLCLGSLLCKLGKITVPGAICSTGKWLVHTGNCN